ncbi:TXN2 [Branchiostoma lanceolatum]|uniref:Thioredoxin, mitochondrial n=1 Tax=Branchiostoma lanceolatum TaxID=7740 RepID=A0A8K0AFG7_BRALA|nr:TXN2 [Branchiostoma lanceolatum]
MHREGSPRFQGRHHAQLVWGKREGDKIFSHRPTAMALRPITRLLQASASAARLHTTTHRSPITSPRLLSARLAAPFSTSRVLGFSFNVQDEEDFKDRVLKNTKPVVVDFHATWCGPCKVLAPRLDKVISKKNGDVELAKVDIDNLQEVAMQYDVRAVPTVVGVKDGKVVDTFMGVVDEDVLEVFVEKLSM